MKRLISALTAILLCVCLLTACSKQDAAYELYTAMNSALENVSSMQGKMDAKIRMEADGENIDMSMIMDIKEIVHSETEVEMSMFLAIDMGELGSMDAKLYFKDGWMYQEIMGMKVKTQISLEEALELVESNADAISALSFGQDAVSVSEVKNIAGGRQLSFTLRGEQIKDALSQMTSSMLGSLNESGMTVSFGEVSYTLLVGADSLPIEQRVTFDMEIKTDDETIKAAYDMNMTEMAYDSAVTIEYPPDLDEYTQA